MISYKNAVSGLKIEEFISPIGESPFSVWLHSLDVSIQAKVQARIFRFENGNLGDCKPVGQGVYEARFIFGPGYRVYFGIYRQRIILLLCGGDKSTQSKDIKFARRLWRDFLEQNLNGKTK